MTHIVDLNIAFVACNKNRDRFRQDPAFIYRCDNLSYALKQKGAAVWVGHISQLSWHQPFDVVVFHRPRWSWRFVLLVKWLQRCGAKVVGDFDDLVFSVELAQFSPGVVNGMVSLASTQKLFDLHSKAMALVDHVTVSTGCLVDRVREKFRHKYVTCIPNAIHWSWLNKPLQDTIRDNSTLAYMPGTRSHDRDFSWIVPALESVLNAFPRVNLQITGPLSHSLSSWGSRVVQKDKMPFEKFEYAFKGVDLNLAPLINSPFNDCKSGIKVIEAAWWGIPTVFSHLPDAQRLVAAGGIQANTLAEFESHLSEWQRNREAFSQTPQALRQAVLEHADVHAFAEDWLETVACVKLVHTKKCTV